MFLDVKLSSGQRCYLEQQQAGSQTGHQQQVVSGPPDDLLQAADGEDVLPGHTLLLLLHPVTTHGVQDRLQDKTTLSLTVSSSRPSASQNWELLEAEL